MTVKEDEEGGGLKEVSEKRAAEKKGRAVAKRVDRAFPRNRRVTVEATRRVAGR